MSDLIFFSILPYASLVVAVVALVYRFRRGRFGLSSLSTQFLEGRELFFGTVPWHFGILGVLTGHLIGFLIPRQVLWFNGEPLRLYILELTGLLFGLLAVVGIINLIVRRITTPRIRVVTSRMDVVVLVLLLVQVVTGVWIALFYRWGSSWFAAAAAPYLWSLLTLQPASATLAPLPFLIKLHIVNVWLLLAITPFSRLVHALIPPISYLWRPYELVIWNQRRRRLPAVSGRSGEARPHRPIRKEPAAPAPEVIIVGHDQPETTTSDTPSAPAR